MPVTKEQVVASLAKIATPDGEPLTESGALSDVVVTDGKVFFSINVDAAAVPRWEPVRKAAESAVRAVPGVQSAMVALTAERAPAAAGALLHLGCDVVVGGLRHSGDRIGVQRVHGPGALDQAPVFVSGPIAEPRHRFDPE